MRRLRICIPLISVALVLMMIAILACASEDGDASPTTAPTPTLTRTPTATAELISTPTTTPTATTSTPAPVECSWLGTWDTTFDSTAAQLSFVYQIEYKIGGFYDWRDGQIQGNISGNTVTGFWGVEPTYSSPNDAGEFIFTMSSDCQSFTGQWRTGTTGPWNDWSGTRAGP